jgi:hypothetical protein
LLVVQASRLHLCVPGVAPDNMAKMDPLDFSDPRSTPFVEPRWRGELPHLYKEGGSYFVTFRLWDAIVPKAAGGTPAPQLPQAPQSPQAAQSLHRVDEIAAAAQPRLRLGSCLLANPYIAKLVEDALRHFHGARYHLAAWCVMPNHVQLVVTPFSPHNPSGVLHS